MFCSRSVRHAFSRPAAISREYRRTITSDADVEQARKYCLSQLRNGDYESYLIRRFVPRSAQNAYDALRTLNLELARLPETVSNPTIGSFRIQFWRDAVNNTFAGKPPREPISILLHQAITDLAATGGDGSMNSIKFWLLRLINTRGQYMENRPFTSLTELEDYAENTYSTLMYTTLAATPLRSMHMDHLASHVGKACGIVALLRSVPVLAAPSRPVQSPAGINAAAGRNPALLLPLDVMSKAGLKEEDVFRQGGEAPGLEAAVYEVATRAHDHILTARDMLRSMKAGAGAGHEFEHAGETEHVYPDDGTLDAAKGDIRQGFSVLLEAVPAADFLLRLEQAQFDPFKVAKSGWKLPWSIWQALKKQEI